METRAMNVDKDMIISPQHNDTDLVVGFIDEWLAEHGWRVEDRVIDFALDVRKMLDEETAEERQPVSVG